jgi:hypothetical protein
MSTNPERQNIEKIHKDLLNTIFTYLPRMFEINNIMLEKSIKDGARKFFNVEFRPVVVGGFAYSKHIETFSNWKTDINKVSPLFSDDIDIKFTILKPLGDVNSNKKLLYTIKLFRVLLLAQIYNLVNTYLKRYASLKFQIRFAGAFGQDIMSLINDLPKEFDTKNPIQLGAFTITYKGASRDYDMGLVDTAFFMRNIDSCNPEELVIRQFCSYKKFLNYKDTSSTLKGAFHDFLYLQEKLKRQVRVILKLARDCKSDITNHATFFEKVKEIKAFTNKLDSIEKKDESLNNLYIGVSELITDLESNVKEDSEKLKSLYNALHGIHQAIVNYSVKTLSPLKEVKDIIGTIGKDIKLDGTDYKVYDCKIPKGELLSFEYLANQEYVIIDTVRMLLQINAFNQANVTLPSAWSDVYKFHKYAVKFLHICYVHYRINDTGFYTTFHKIITDFEKNVFERYNDIVSKNKSRDVSENYKFWTDVARIMWNITDVVKDYMEISKIVLPYTSGQNVFIGLGGSLFKLSPENVTPIPVVNDDMKIHDNVQMLPVRNSSQEKSKSWVSEGLSAYKLSLSRNNVQSVIAEVLTTKTKVNAEKDIEIDVLDVNETYMKLNDIYIPGRYDSIIIDTEAYSMQGGKLNNHKTIKKSIKKKRQCYKK